MKARWYGVVLGVAAMLAACGGGGGGATPSDSSSEPVTSPSGPRIEPYELSVVRSAAVAPAPAASAAGAAAQGGAPAVVALAPMSAAELSELAASQLNGGSAKARQIGSGRALQATATSAGFLREATWQVLPDGRTVASLGFRSTGAAAVRLALLAERLPPAARVRVFAPTGGEVLELSGAQVLAGQGSQGPRPADTAAMFWLPTVSGDQATLEIVLPAGSRASDLAVSVPTLSHLWVDLASRQADAQLKIGQAGPCNVDATCAADWAGDARSVARMLFTSGANSYFCTGTLMADVAGSGTPYFLSARHCISEPAVAGTLETFWFYQSAACNAVVLSPQATRLSGGATLLYAATATDTSFMRLNSAPPAGVRFAGSLLAAPAVNLAVGGLHHPSGDLLKLSQGVVGSYASCVGTTCSEQSRPDAGGFLTVRWSSGTTESGSSGSALFSTIGSRRYVTGNLFAGLASCSTAGDPDYYGRFDTAYRSALYQWLGEVPGAR